MRAAGKWLDGPTPHAQRGGCFVKLASACLDGALTVPGRIFHHPLASPCVAIGACRFVEPDRSSYIRLASGLSLARRTAIHSLGGATAAKPHTAT